MVSHETELHADITNATANTVKILKIFFIVILPFLKMSLVKIFLSIIAIALLTKCNPDYNEFHIWRINDLSELDSDHWSVSFVDSNYNGWYNDVRGVEYQAYNKHSHKYYNIVVYDLPEKKHLMISLLLE